MARDGWSQIIFVINASLFILTTLRRCQRLFLDQTLDGIAKLNQARFKMLNCANCKHTEIREYINHSARSGSVKYYCGNKKALSYGDQVSQRVACGRHEPIEKGSVLLTVEIVKKYINL